MDMQQPWPMALRYLYLFYAFRIVAALASLFKLSQSVITSPPIPLTYVTTSQGKYVPVQKPGRLPASASVRLVPRCAALGAVGRTVVEEQSLLLSASGSQHALRS